jgi:hypothetical protein
MAITNVNWCDFIVWTTKDMHVERIIFNSTIWDTFYSKLKSIYSSFILPEIIYPRIHLDQDIIEYPPFPLSTASEVFDREP